MTIIDVLQRIEQEAEQARANARENDPMSASGAFDAGRCSGLLEAAGIAIDAVQRHLGHASISTTAVYLHNDIDLGPVWAKMSGEVAA